MARIGNKMAQVVWMVRIGPRTRIDVAREVGPYRSLMYGYQTIRRAIQAGLVRLSAPLPGRRGASLELV